MKRYSTQLDQALADPANQIYFDATLTGQRPIGVRKAIAAGKHIYCEKPSATTSTRRLRCIAKSRRLGSRTAWCRTSCGCPVW